MSEFVSVAEALRFISSVFTEFTGEFERIKNPLVKVHVVSLETTIGFWISKQITFKDNSTVRDLQKYDPSIEKTYMYLVNRLLLKRLAIPSRSNLLTLKDLQKGRFSPVHRPKVRKLKKLYDKSTEEILNAR